MRLVLVVLILSIIFTITEAKIDCDAKGKHVAFYRDCFTPNCTKPLEEACKKKINKKIKKKKGICPLDRINNNCKGIREFECTIKLIEPTLNCEKLEIVGGKEITGDPICIKKNMSSILDIKHNINCNFIQNGMNYTQLPQNKNFTDLRTGIDYPTFKDIENSFKYFVNVDNGKVKKKKNLNKNFLLVCFDR